MKKGVVIGASIAIVCATATALLPEGLWTAILPMIGAIGGIGAYGASEKEEPMAKKEGQN